MAAVILYPNSDNTKSNVWYSSGTDAYALLDDTKGSYDDLTTYISNPGGAGTTTCICGIESIAPYQPASISDVDFETRQRREATINPLSYIRVGGSDYWLLTTAGGWITQSTNSGTNPDTSVQWTVSDVVALLLHWTCTAGAPGQYANCSAMNVEVTYAPSQSGYIYLWPLWLPLLSGIVAPTAKEIVKVLQFCKVRPTSKEDFIRIREKIAVRPKYLEMAA